MHLKSIGLHHEQLLKYTPQQNDRAEKIFQTVTQQTRTMLIENGLPLWFWPEAKRAAVYIFNRTIIKHDFAPLQAFTGNAFRYLDHLKRF
jgi:hypothetical protein